MHPSLTRGVRPILTRHLSPRSEARRVVFRPSTTSHAPTESVPEDKEVEFSLDEEKREEHADEESRSAQGEYENRRRFRTYSEGSLMTIDDDENLSPCAFENKPTNDTRETCESSRTLFGYALPHFPSRNEISSYVVKCAPCFWWKSERHLNMTARSIALRLQFLDAFSGLVQAASASFLAVALTSEKIVDRNAPHVDSGSDPAIYAPNMWSINGNVMLAGLFGTTIFFLMIFSRRVIREVNLVGSLRSMWCMLWIVPLEVYVTICMFGMRIQLCTDCMPPRSIASHQRLASLVRYHRLPQSDRGEENTLRVIAGHSDSLYFDMNTFRGANMRVILPIGLDQAVLVDSFHGMVSRMGLRTRYLQHTLRRPTWWFAGIQERD